MMRLFTTTSILLAVTLIGGATIMAISDPYDVRRQELRDRLQDVAPTDGEDVLVPDADYREFQKQIIERAQLWDPLVAPETPAAKGIDTAAALQGVQLMPGKIGSGATAKLRIRTPGTPKGGWFKKGDSVRPNVVIHDITAEGVVFSVRENGKSATVTVAFP